MDQEYLDEMLYKHEDSYLQKDSIGRALYIKKRKILDSNLYNRCFDFYG